MLSSSLLCSPCGCGSGCTGCLTCGICKVCATDGSIEGDHTLKEYYISKTGDEEVKATYSEGRQRVKKMKQTSTKKKGKDRLKVAVEEKSVDIGESSFLSNWSTVNLALIIPVCVCMLY